MPDTLKDDPGRPAPEPRETEPGPGPAKLWVIEQYVGMPPKLTVHTLVKETQASFTVKGGRRGGRMLRKDAAGRSYYRTEAEAVRRLRRLYEDERDKSARMAQRMGHALTLGDADLLRFAADHDDVRMAVESLIS